MSLTGSAIVLAWLAILLLTFAMAGLLRQVRILTELRTSSGGAGSLRSVQVSRSGQALLGNALPASGAGYALLFVTDECGSCERALAVFTAAAAADGQGRRHIAVSGGNGPASLSEDVLLVADRPDLFVEVGVDVTPYFLALGPDLAIQASLPVGDPMTLERAFEQLEQRTVQRR